MTNHRRAVQTAALLSFHGFTVKHLPLTAAVTGLVLALGCQATVVQPGRHPAYLRSLSDLRHARAHLERRGGDPGMKWDEHTAIGEIDAAIQDLKSASMDDGKNLRDHPPVDVHMGYAGRLHQALELLRQAERDCRGEEDNGSARAAQARALGHIREAIRFTEQGLADSRP
jgi:hypothetical protein